MSGDELDEAVNTCSCSRPSWCTLAVPGIGKRGVEVRSAAGAILASSAPIRATGCPCDQVQFAQNSALDHAHVETSEGSRIHAAATRHRPAAGCPCDRIDTPCNGL